LPNQFHHGDGLGRKKGLDGWVGASGERTIQVTIWVPDADRDGKPRTDQHEWKDKALRMFSEVFGKGATAMPPADGAWKNPNTNQLVMEHPIMVFCYITPQQASDAARMKKVGDFCREMGKAMYQGEVGLLIGDRYFMISTF
jgi:hypothetical protein